ncbi:hypothetical protein Leryth_026660, partial [Lithospermum erythrorhizon]
MKKRKSRYKLLNGGKTLMNLVEKKVMIFGGKHQKKKSKSIHNYILTQGLQNYVIT